MRLQNGDVLMYWPLSLHCITAGWTYNNGSAHKALDFRAAIGTPVYAVEDGTVAIAYTWNGKVTNGDTNSYGNMVKLSHAHYCGKSLETLYAHLSKICVQRGQTVKEGQLIGYSGVTGNCMGAHLHFEVRYNGVRVNPLNWFDTDFYTASDTVKAHLGSYASVRNYVEETAQTSNVDKMQTVTISNVSAGDAMRFVNLAKELNVGYKITDEN